MKKKRIIDLTPEEIAVESGEAWAAAAHAALKQGLAITGSRNGRLVRLHPDGHFEDLGPVASLSDESTASKRSQRKSVA